MSLALAGVTNGEVHKGQVDLELLGGIAVESTNEGSNQDDILAGATGADLDAWFASGGVSWFRTNNLQLGIAGFYSSMDGSETATIPQYLPGDPLDDPSAELVHDADVELMVYGAGGRAKWHFSPKSPVIPYIGIQVSWATADIDVTGTSRIVINDETVPASEADIDESDSASGILWGPLLGLRVQLAENVDLLIEGQYHMWAGSISDVLDNGYAIAIGLGIATN